LLVCNGNETLNELWYNVIVLNDAAKAASAEGETAAAEGESIDGVQVYPNPFNPNTLFRFTIPGPAGALAPVKLQLFNLSGQIVRTLVDEDLPKGIHQRRWNGNNDAGYRVASGVYLYRLQVGERVYHGRVQMIK
jgi:flagellar hook assembly protein FlgD